MEDMEYVPAQSLGGFFVQYTDSARDQASRLDGELRNKMHDHLSMVAAVNPQLHGKPEPGYATQDRRSLEFERLTIAFWLSVSTKILTVVDVQDGDDPLTRSTPGPSTQGGFVGFEVEEDACSAPQVVK